ncbi:hypothetical protein C8R44DRAFT_739539 [Mycena epipterygia]|nr:hypothetical protein C8R44DRAFT_739539 [Mycena epipterygia]
MASSPPYDQEVKVGGYAWGGSKGRRGGFECLCWAITWRNEGEGGGGGGGRVAQETAWRERGGRGRGGKKRGRVSRGVECLAKASSGMEFKLRLGAADADGIDGGIDGGMFHGISNSQISWKFSIRIKTEPKFDNP